MLGWMACWNVHKQVREDIKVQIICKSKYTKPYPSLVPRPFLVGRKLLVHAAVCVAHGDKLIVYLYRHTHTVQRHIFSVGGQWDKEGQGINLNDFINSLIKHILIITDFWSQCRWALSVHSPCSPSIYLPFSITHTPLHSLPSPFSLPPPPHPFSHFKASWSVSTSAPETTTTRSLLYVPSKESIQMVAIGDEWVDMDTNKQLLWLLTVGGV